MAHANLIDSILNEPKTASVDTVDINDDLMEPSSGLRSAHTASSRRAASFAIGEDSLAEVALQHTVSANISKRAAAKLTIEAALKFASDLPTTTRGLSMEIRQKVASAAKPFRDAVARLQRLANKTSTQMRQDGATKLADYLNAELVPMWAKQANADLAMVGRIHATVFPQQNKAASSKELLAERSMSDAEVAGYIKKLLNDGVTPKDVEQKLKKLAELQVFNRGFATDKLRSDAGIVGYAFMEPNTYMDNCNDSFQRMDTKLGGVRAKSVRQIAACTGCQHFKKSASEKRCSLYRLPIIANQAELMPIINNLTKGATNKKAALVAQANRETERPSTAIKQASRHADSILQRQQDKVAVRTASTREKKAAAAEFTSADVLVMHKAGKKMDAIYEHAVSKVGSQQANASVRQFITELKGSNTKVALTQIDCTLLKGKLATSNGIVGEKKCASCTYRRGMSCGLTGGTLLTFPGMDKVKSNHRIASGAPEDGLGMMKDFELADSITPGDIELNKPDFVDVEVTGFSKVDL
jgi:hypothetical protein